MDSPWQSFSVPEPDAEFIGLLTELPLSRYRAIPKFLRMTRQIQSQLADSEGLVAYALRTDVPRRKFWTVSIWESEEALRTFVRENPHGEIMVALRDEMGETRFDRFAVSGKEVPPTIDEAFKRARD